MHARHHEIEREKNLRWLRPGSLIDKGSAGHQMLLELEIVFGELDPEKHRTQNNREQQECDRCVALSRLGAVDGHGHCKTAADQNRCVDATQQYIQVIAGIGKPSPATR